MTHLLGVKTSKGQIPLSSLQIKPWPAPLRAKCHIALSSGKCFPLSELSATSEPMTLARFFRMSITNPLKVICSDHYLSRSSSIAFSFPVDQFRSLQAWIWANRQTWYSPVWHYLQLRALRSSNTYLSAQLVHCSFCSTRSPGPSIKNLDP